MIPMQYEEEKKQKNKAGKCLEIIGREKSNFAFTKKV